MTSQTDRDRSNVVVFYTPKHNEYDYNSQVLFDDERAARKSDYEFFKEFFAR